MGDSGQAVCSPDHTLVPLSHEARALDKPLCMFSELGSPFPPCTGEEPSLPVLLEAPWPITIARQQEEGLGENSMHLNTHLEGKDGHQPGPATGAEGRTSSPPHPPLPPTAPHHCPNDDLNSSFYPNSMETTSRLNL